MNAKPQSVYEALAEHGGNAVLEILRSSGDVEFIPFKGGVIPARAMFDRYRDSPAVYEIEAMVLYNDQGADLVQWPRP